MRFNYAKEKRRFDNEWKKLTAEYSEAGFDAAGIQAMRTFDWELFCQRRTYGNSDQAYPSEMVDNSDNGGHSTMFRKFPSLSSN